MIQNDLK